jgi:hypothetical protein
VVHDLAECYPHKRPCPHYELGPDFRAFAEAFNAHRYQATVYAREVVCLDVYSYCGVCGRDQGSHSMFKHRDVECPGLDDHDELYWYLHLIYMCIRLPSVRTHLSSIIDPQVNVEALENAADTISEWAEWASTIYAEGLCRASALTAMWVTHVDHSV